MEINVLTTPVTEAAVAVLPLFDALDDQYNHNPQMTTRLFMAELHRLQLQAAEIDPLSLKTEGDFTAAYTRGEALILAAKQSLKK